MSTETLTQRRERRVLWAGVGLSCLVMAGAGGYVQAHDREGAIPPLAAEQPARVETTVFDSSGEAIGSLSIEPRAQAVRVVLHVEGLQPGTHAVQFHEHGVCEPPDFESAGAHFDPGGGSHGMPDADEDYNDPDHHAGDMLNQKVDDLGTLDTVIVNQSVTLTGRNALLDEDGSALVIHAAADDFRTQPAGASGARVACAPIVASAKRSVFE